MSSLLKDAKDFYSMFYKANIWDEIAATKILINLNEYEDRLSIVLQIYKIVLESSKSSDSIKRYVTTDLSINEVAEVLGKNTNNIKSELYYFNSTVGRSLMVGDYSILRIVITRGDIDDYLWKEIYERIEKCNIVYGNRLFAEKKIFTNKNLLIHIPKVKGVKKYVTDDEFNHFMRLIEPYFISVRKKKQRLINESNIVDYFNYIMNPAITLAGADLTRRNKVLSLMGLDTKKVFNNEFNIIKSADNKVTTNDNVVKNENIGYIAKRVQY